MTLEKTDWNSRSLAAAAIAVAVLLLLLLASCSGGTAGDSVTFRLIPGDIMPSAADQTGFSEKECVVLRCASFASNGAEIGARTSRSRDLKPTTLVFVRPDVLRETGAFYFLAAAAPITGKEYEYDMARASFYRIDSSARALLNGYGIPYADWQVGAVNSTEKFPCCE